MVCLRICPHHPRRPWGILAAHPFDKGTSTVEICRGWARVRVWSACVAFIVPPSRLKHVSHTRISPAKCVSRSYLDLLSPDSTRSYHTSRIMPSEYRFGLHGFRLDKVKMDEISTTSFEDDSTVKPPSSSGFAVQPIKRPRHYEPTRDHSSYMTAGLKRCVSYTYC